MTTIFQSAWWTTSRTLWFNVLVALAAMADMLTPFIPANAVAKVTLTLAIINIVLRILTQAKLIAEKTQ